MQRKQRRKLKTQPVQDVVRKVVAILCVNAAYASSMEEVKHAKLKDARSLLLCTAFVTSMVVNISVRKWAARNWHLLEVYVAVTGEARIAVLRDVNP